MSPEQVKRVIGYSSPHCSAFNVWPFIDDGVVIRSPSVAKELHWGIISTPLLAHWLRIHSTSVRATPEIDCEKSCKSPRVLTC